jgi:ubiquinone/menaquinone biosynthesis C-methylase UbiE
MDRRVTVMAQTSSFGTRTFQFKIKHLLFTIAWVAFLIPALKFAVLNLSGWIESIKSDAPPLVTGVPYLSKLSARLTREGDNLNPAGMMAVLPRITITNEIAEAVTGIGHEVQDEETPNIPRPVKVYLGRRIAQTMHFSGAEWLIRNEREREERCSLMLANLGLKPNQIVCDMGCGNGFYTLQIAKMMGEQGTVIGVDVQPEMLQMLRDRMDSEKIENVVPILGSYHSPRLPRGMIDLVLMVDVYHEFSHPQPMLSGIRNSLKPGGQVVLVEYRAEDKSVPIKPLHKMSKKQINREMKANGFKLVSEFDQLPWQHMMFFGLDPQWQPNAQQP